MCIGVFDDRLEDHRWNDSVVQMRINRHLLSYSSSESAVLHGQIHLDELHLVTQGDELGIAPLKRDTKKTAKLFQHKISSLHITSHETGDAVHGVEKKVRIKLHAQSSHLRLNELRLQLGFGSLFFAKALVVTEAAEEKESSPEEDHVVDQFGIEMKGQTMPVRHARAAKRQRREDKNPNHLLEDTDGDA